MRFKTFFYRITHWETWHYLVKYIPIAPFWLWHCLKARSLWFFTSSNPTLTFGGFEGETKKEMYAQLPPGTYPKSLFISHGSNIDLIATELNRSGLKFPFVVKPDAGMMGFMFRKIYDHHQLARYHAVMPADYIIQELSGYPLEVSVFYFRYPGTLSGTITGFIKKEFLQVTGDGISTLDQLIAGYPRAGFRKEEIRAKHNGRLQHIIPEGKPYILSHALNLSRGGKLVSLEHEKDDRLLKIFDDISLHTKHFYYGRYDIKCASIDLLKQGKAFTILEYNGCGAEPHHIYGNNNSLLQAYRIVLKHWKVLADISRINHHNGATYWEYKKGRDFLKNAKAHFKILKQLDLQTTL